MWITAIPLVSLLKVTSVKPIAFQHFGKFVRQRKKADGFRQVNIGRAASGNQLAEPGHDVKRVHVVQPSEDRRHRFGEFQTHHFAPGFQNPVQFFKPFVHVGDVSDSKAHHHGVNAVVRKRNGFNITLNILDSLSNGKMVFLGFPGQNHVPVDIVQNHFSGLSHLASRQNGQIPGAAADIQHPVSVP